jgi:hypothetical protein
MVEFSPDSRHLAYVIETEDGKQKIVVDGVAGDLSYARVDSLVFSPDSQRLAYTTSNTYFSLPQFVVVDGVEGQHYFCVSDVVFSPDSRRIGYRAVSVDLKEFVVVDGVEGIYYEGIGVPLHYEGTGTYRYSLFSPDSQRVAYHAVGEDDVRFIVVDGEEGKRYFMTGMPFFSPDSKNVAYRAETGAYIIDADTRAMMVVNGREGKEYGYVSDPVFGPDGQSVAYKASTGCPYIDDTAQKFVVINDIEGKPYDDVFDIVFDSATSFHYIARQGNDFYLVENPISGSGGSAIEIEPSPGAILADGVRLEQASVTDGILERSGRNGWRPEVYEAGDPCFIVTGTMSNVTDEDLTVNFHAEGYDAAGEEISWTLDVDPGPLSGIVQKSVSAHSSRDFTLHLSYAEGITLVQISAGVAVYP